MMTQNTNPAFSGATPNPSNGTSFSPAVTIRFGAVPPGTNGPRMASPAPRPPVAAFTFRQGPSTGNGNPTAPVGIVPGAAAPVRSVPVDRGPTMADQAPPVGIDLVALASQGQSIGSTVNVRSSQGPLHRGATGAAQGSPFYGQGQGTNGNVAVGCSGNPAVMSEIQNPEFDNQSQTGDDQNDYL